MSYKFATSRVVIMLMSAVFASMGQHSYADPTPESSYLKTFRVKKFDKVVVPSDSDLYMGKTVQLKAYGPEALRLDLGYKFIAKTNGPINAIVGGIQESLPAGSPLTRREASGGRIAELPEGALILCQEPVQRNLAQGLASAVTLGVTQLAAKYAVDVQLCAVDADRDGKLDKLFLGGAKQQRDLEFTDIDPVSYQYRENYRVDDAKLDLSVETKVWGSVLLVATVEENGVRHSLSWLSFENNGKMVDQDPIIQITKNKLPQEIKIGSAVLLVKKYDAETKVVDIEVSKDFDVQKVDWVLEPYVLYVYVPH